MQTRIASIDSRLRARAARHASHATLAVTADDLYQVAVEEILSTCKPQDNDTYLLRLADWRMRNAANKERTYTVRIDDIDDIDENGDDSGQFADISGSAEDTAIKNEQTSLINRVNLQLKELDRQILALLADGESQRQIARDLGTSQTRVRYRIEKIKQMFEQAGLAPSLA